MVASTDDTREHRYQRLIELGIALSAERNYNRLLEAILVGAKELTRADGGTLYLVSEDRKSLTFEILRNDTLGTAMGGTSGVPISLPPVSLYDPEGKPNRKNVSACAAVMATPISIIDAYNDKNFDFTGTKAFDARTGYRSTSFLTVPLKNHEDEVVGVLQLINALDEHHNVVPFSEEVTPLVVALASQAAMTLDNQMLLDAQKRLLLAFIQLLAGAIDAKSPYTGGHCRRVPHLTEMLARAAEEADTGPLAGFSLSEDQWYELEVAAGLHDCGKVTTPEYVVDKATKLETIYNRIHEIRMRFEVVKRDAEIAYLNAVIAGGDPETLKAQRDSRLAELDADFAFVAECNVGGEFMAPDKVERVRRIADTTWVRTLDDTLGLAWEERARKAAHPTTVPTVERLLDDKPEHVIAHNKPPIGPDNPWAGQQIQSRRDLQSRDFARDTHARGSFPHQRSHRPDDHHARGAAAAAQSSPRSRDCRRPSREDGWIRLSERPQTR
jgi:hypothetical protein